MRLVHTHIACTLHRHFLKICIAHLSAIGSHSTLFPSLLLIAINSRMVFVTRQSSYSLYSSIELHCVAPTVYMLSPLERHVWMPTTEGQVLRCHEHRLTVGFSCFCRCRWSLWPQSGNPGSKAKFIYRVAFFKNGMRVGRWLRWESTCYTSMRTWGWPTEPMWKAVEQHPKLSCDLHMHAHTNACTHACNSQMQTCMYIHTYIIHIGKNKRTHGYVHIEVYTYNTCTHMKTHMHTHTNTCIHMHIQSCMYIYIQQD